MLVLVPHRVIMMMMVYGWSSKLRVGQAVFTGSGLVVAVLAVLTLAEAGALNSCLEAFTVPLNTP